jgi:carboxymethylenebutenolidase
MCDDDIHQGQASDATLSRRAFGIMTAAAASIATTAAAAAKVVEKDVDITTPDGKADAVLTYPEGKGPWPGVIIWTDIMGLRPVFRQMAQRLAGEGYVVLTPNPFYRVKRGLAVEGPIDFNKPEDRAKLMPLRASITAEGTARDAAAYVAFLDAQPQTSKSAKIGTQGYCMGGPMVLWSAGAQPGRINAGASFHGGGLATDAPDSPHLLAPKLKGGYLIAVADNDDQKEPAAKDRLKAALDAANVTAKVEVYKGANHGWCVPGSAAYNEPAAEKAWAELLALYKTHLA